MAEHENEIFIDADSGFSNEKDTFENIIVRQILECTKVLSRDMVTGHNINPQNPMPKEDVHELVINHVDTLKMLLCSYISEDDKNDKRIKVINEDIDKFLEAIKERTINVTGRGPTKLKDIKGMNSDSVHFKEFIDYKAKKYRDMFEVLIKVYNGNKAYIKSLEEE